MSGTPTQPLGFEVIIPSRGPHAVAQTIRNGAHALGKLRRVMLHDAFQNGVGFAIAEKVTTHIATEQSCGFEPAPMPGARAGRCGRYAFDNEPDGAVNGLLQILVASITSTSDEAHGRRR